MKDVFLDKKLSHFSELKKVDLDKKIQQLIYIFLFTNYYLLLEEKIFKLTDLGPKYTTNCQTKRYFDLHSQLGEPQKQIVGKSWEFGPTGLTPLPLLERWDFSVNLSEIFGKKGSNMP